MSTVTVGVACEDNGHFFAVRCLVDGTLVEQHTWLDGIIESCRSWHGLVQDELWYKYDPEDAFDIRPITVGGKRITPQGHINGEPLKPEAGMWRRVLLLFCHSTPRPEIVILARDMDGYPGRRAGMLQVRDHLPWPFKVVIATAEPEIEAWRVSGFVPGEHERDRLKKIKDELSFDPTLESHRLTSRPNDALTDSKRVLALLCQKDKEREDACLVNRELLRARGQNNGLAEFLVEIEQRIVPVFGGPR